jgi:hypothetical protein
MITCGFSGNFGNSLIQYAITRTVADKNGYEFGFNPKFNYDYHNGYNQLDFLDLDYGIVHDASFHENPNGIEYLWEEPVKTFYHKDQVNFHPYSPEIFSIRDNTKLVIPCCQDARYYDKEKLASWIKIKSEKEQEYKVILESLKIELDNNTCVINVRGGEYLGIPNVLLRIKYWEDAVNHMRELNPSMRFVTVTDDVDYAKSMFNTPVLHHSIGLDYYIINNAKYLILSNSSFALIPAWLNNHDPYVIAPMWWARHNVSEGNYWASSNVFTFGEDNLWYFLDRDNQLYNYNKIIRENKYRTDFQQ